MLQTVRDKSSGLFTWIVVILIAGSFVFLGIGSYVYSGWSSGSEVAATVGNQKIHVSDVKSLALRIARSQGDVESKDFPKNSFFYQQALQREVYNKLLQQTASKFDLVISKEQENNVIKSVPAFQYKGKFSRENYLEYLRRSNYTDSSFRKEISQNLASKQLILGVLASSYVGEKDFVNLARNALQKRDIKYVVLNNNNHKENIVIESDEVANYYTQNQNRFVLPEKVSIEYISFSVEDVLSKVEVSDEEITEHYNQNKSAYTKEDSSGQSIQLSLSEVKESIKKELLEEKAEDKWSSMSEDLANLSFENPGTLEFASDLDLKVETTDLFTREGSDTGVAANSKIVEASFSDAVLKDGNNSDLISFDKDTTIILRVKQHVPMKQKALHEAENDIEEILKREHARDAAKDHADKIVDELKENNDLSAVAKKYNLEFKTKQGVNLQESELDRNLLGEVFDMIPPKDGKDSFKVIPLMNGSWAIVDLTKVTDGSLDSLNEEELDNFKKITRARIGEEEYKVLEQNLRDEIKIAIH